MKSKAMIRTPQVLKSILEIMVVIIFIKMIVGLFFGFYQIFFKKGNLEYELFDYKIYDLTAENASLIFFHFILGILFLYLVLLFRNLVREFYNDDLFSKSQIKIMDTMGKLIITLSIGKSLLRFLTEAVLDKRISFILDLSSYDSFWFMLALGLFFVFLSKVFNNARLLKEENDLTV